MEREKLALVTIIFAVVEAQDGHVTCPTVWINNDHVTVTCELSKTSLATKCLNASNLTAFLAGTTSMCTVEDGANCMASTPLNPALDTCWCQDNLTHYLFAYHFTADRSRHSGDWSCHKSCTDLGGVLIPLRMTSSPGCFNVTVVEGPPNTRDKRTASGGEKGGDVNNTTTTTDSDDDNKRRRTSPQTLGIRLAAAGGFCVLFAAGVYFFKKHRRKRKSQALDNFSAISQPPATAPPVNAPQVTAPPVNTPVVNSPAINSASMNVPLSTSPLANTPVINSPATYSVQMNAPAPNVPGNTDACPQKTGGNSACYSLETKPQDMTVCSEVTTVHDKLQVQEESQL